MGSACLSLWRAIWDHTVLQYLPLSRGDIPCLYSSQRLVLDYWHRKDARVDLVGFVLYIDGISAQRRSLIPVLTWLNVECLFIRQTMLPLRPIHQPNPFNLQPWLYRVVVFTVNTGAHDDGRGQVLSTGNWRPSQFSFVNMVMGDWT